MLAEILGLVMIIGSFQVKTPIISNCIAQGSTKGIPENSVTLETVALLISACYNIRNEYPLLSWGEGLTILAQNLVLLGTIWYYTKAATGSVIQRLMRLGLLVGMSFVLPAVLLPIMPLASMLIGWSATIPLIVGNYQRKHTGQLSQQAQTTVVLGSSARLYTTLKSVDDILVQFGAIVGFTLQATILLQIFMLEANTKVWKERMQRGEPVEPDEFKQIGAGFFVRIQRSKAFKRISKRLSTSRAAVQTRAAVHRISQSRQVTDFQKTILGYRQAAIDYKDDTVKSMNVIMDYAKRTRVVSAMVLLYQGSEDVLKEMPDIFYFVPTFDVLIDKIYSVLRIVVEPILDARDEALAMASEASANLAGELESSANQAWKYTLDTSNQIAEDSQVAFERSLNTAKRTAVGIFGKKKRG